MRKKMYFSMFWKNFQTYGGIMHFWLKILNLFIFIHCLKQNFSQYLIITSQAEGNYPFPSSNVFWKLIPTPSRKVRRERNHEAEEMTKIKLARVLARSFVKSYHLCTLNFFLFLFCCTIVSIQSCWSVKVL